MGLESSYIGTIRKRDRLKCRNIKHRKIDRAPNYGLSELINLNKNQSPNFAGSFNLW